MSNHVVNSFDKNRVRERPVIAHVTKLLNIIDEILICNIYYGRAHVGLCTFVDNKTI